MYMLSALYENCDFAHSERGKHLLLPKYNQAMALWPSIRVTTAGSDKPNSLRPSLFLFTLGLLWIDVDALDQLRR
jgi:hypothetical protein